MRLTDTDAQTDAPGGDRGQAGPDSAGQSGDSPIADDAVQSVEELADTGQDYEAGVVQGVEDAAAHPERPVYSHEDQSRPSGTVPEP